MEIIFYIASAAAVISSILVVLVSRVIHSLLYMIVSMIAVSIVFFTMGAPLAAALEIINYAGAVMVLFLFAVMILNRGTAMDIAERESFAPKAIILPGLLALILLISFVLMVYDVGIFSDSAGGTGPKEIGIALFGPYLLGVEFASVLLLAGLVGAFHIGRNIRDRR